MNWNHLLDELKEACDLTAYTTTEHPDAEITQFLLTNLTQAFVAFSRSDPDRPEFIPYANPVFNLLGPNPDNTHCFATLDGGNCYRIAGNRGTVYRVDFQFGYDCLGFAEKIGATTMLNIDDIAMDADGNFEFLVGSEKPVGYNGNWYQVDPRVDYCMVRQIGYHEGEVDAAFTIENLSPPSTTHRPQMDDALIQRVVNYVKFNSIGGLGFLKQVENDGVFNTLKNYDYSNQGGMKNQVFQQGLYDIPKSQAMIASVKVPEPCGYWSVTTTNRLWQTNEAVYAQGHFNGAVDRADSDGITRIVFSHSDSGVRNWIDLNGCEKGYALIRWLDCQAPEPDVRLVPLAEVEQCLPADTPRVTPEQRQAAINRRALARQRRRYW